MSRAFVRETDDRGENLPPIWPPLPAGVTNYITPGGAKKVQEELEALMEKKRASAADQTDGDRRKLEEQIRQYQQRLQTFVVTPPPAALDAAAFSAAVTVRDQRGEETTYRIVGIDETDLDRDWISWRSPLARSLLGRKAGERVVFDAPGGRQMLEIVRVAYVES